MFGLARHKAHDGILYDEWNDAWQRVGVNGLPGDLTWEEFVAASSRYRHSQNMAGTRPLELLTWSGEGWLLPRAYIELLDRWAQREEELGQPGPGLLLLRRPGPVLGRLADINQQGLRHQGPPCSGAAFRPYTDLAEENRHAGPCC
ncbi:hypothetical protein [Streptomyces sp. NPDC050388]|uniref:hypothetical protein n=1 Tax=Streptomyces sp. NPDC050388 TaxID=3155781 RepID=UPI003448A087